MRRVTDRTIGEFFAEEIAGPLGADFRLTVPASLDSRVAPTLPPPGQTEDLVATAPGANAEPNPTDRAGLTIRDGNSEAWRRSEIPAASGYGDARSAALVQSVMACGGEVHGVRLLSPEGTARAWEEQFRGEDRILGMSMRYGMGYGMFGSTFGWGGWGGSMLMIEPDSGMVVAYVTNQMPEGDSGGYAQGLELVMSAYDGLKGLQPQR